MILVTYYCFEKCSLFRKLRLEGFEPPTFGSVDRKSENVTDLESNSYKSGENNLTSNLTENRTKIQRDLEKIINRWVHLPRNIKHAIMVLINEE